MGGVADGGVCKETYMNRPDGEDGFGRLSVFEFLE